MSWPKAQGNKFQMKPVDNINYKISLPMCLGLRTGLCKLRIGGTQDSSRRQQINSELNLTWTENLVNSFISLGFLIVGPMAN